MKMYKETEQYGVIAAGLGAVGMLAWLIPIIGIVVTLMAVVVGLYAYTSEENGFPTAGIVLGILGLLLTMIRSGMVYYYG